MAVPWLNPIPCEINDGETVYSLNEIVASGLELRKLSEDGFLVLKRKPGDLWIHFAVLEFKHSDAKKQNIMLSSLFHGDGPSGNLREFRHTYWGERSDGYIFYATGSLIIAGLTALREFFDIA